MDSDGSARDSHILQTDANTHNILVVDILDEISLHFGLNLDYILSIECFYFFDTLSYFLSFKIT